MIIKVQLSEDNNPNIFHGREYHYVADTSRFERELEVGDIVIAPTYRGDNRARVTAIGISEADVSPEILPKLKTITQIALPVCEADNIKVGHVNEYGKIVLRVVTCDTCIHKEHHESDPPERCFCDSTNRWGSTTRAYYCKRYQSR